MSSWQRSLACMLTPVVVSALIAEASCGTEPLPPGHEIHSAYREGKTAEAEKLLCKHIKETCRLSLWPMPAKARSSHVKMRQSRRSCSWCVLWT